MGSNVFSIMRLFGHANINISYGQTMEVMPASSSSSNVSLKAGEVDFDQFPVGLRVLLVDDDPTCLIIIEKMLRMCNYQVTKCSRAEDALSLLRENKNGYDVVISDVHMPDMDGFKLLEQVGLLMDIPVIMMSADDRKSVVLKGVTHGACDYLIKPVRMEALKNIWQHVLRRKQHGRKEINDVDRSCNVEDGDGHHKPSEDLESSIRKSSKKRKDEDNGAVGRVDPSTSKKQRIAWSMDLHQQFVEAVDILGIDRAVPKKIMELMNVPGLTKENISSHLQKYRLYLRRLMSGVSQHQGGLNNSFVGLSCSGFGSMPSLKGLDQPALYPGYKRYNVRSTFEVPQNSTFQGTMGLVHSAQYPNVPTNKGGHSIGEVGQNNTSNMDHLNTFLAENSCRTTMAERLTGSGYQDNIFDEQYGQEDLMSVLLKPQHDHISPVDNDFSFDGCPLDILPV